MNRILTCIQGTENLYLIHWLPGHVMDLTRQLVWPTVAGILELQSHFIEYNYRYSKWPNNLSKLRKNILQTKFLAPFPFLFPPHLFSFCFTHGLVSLWLRKFTARCLTSIPLILTPMRRVAKFTDKVTLLQLNLFKRKFT